MSHPRIPRSCYRGDYTSPDEDFEDHRRSPSKYSTKEKKATVEITVKVKKHKQRDPDDSSPRKLAYPKGSWGDLLSRSSNREKQFSDGQRPSRKSDIYCKRQNSGISYEDDATNKAFCHVVPLTKDLYMETHTRVLGKASVSAYGDSNTHRKKEKSEVDGHTKICKIYEQQNSILRAEIDKLRWELDELKMTNNTKKDIEYSKDPVKAVSTSIIRRQGVPIKNAKTETSKPKTTFSLPPRRESGSKEMLRRASSSFNEISKQSVAAQTSVIKSSTTQESDTKSNSAEGNSQSKEFSSVCTDKESEADQYRENRLREENEILRKEATDLMSEVEKSKKEQQESIMTIKELYHLAEILKRENQQLIGAQEQHHALQEKLMSAVTENQSLKQYLESLLSNKSSENQDKLAKLRHVIDEVKSTIELEIKGIAGSDNVGRSQKPDGSGVFDLNISASDSALLNDTNASEIQKIFSNIDEFNAPDMSNLISEKNSLSSKPSRRTSTPIEISKTKTRRYSTEGKVDQALRNIRSDISKTFKPIHMELMQSSSDISVNSRNVSPTSV